MFTIYEREAIFKQTKNKILLPITNCQTLLERKTGLEPATWSLEGYRSTKWATFADYTLNKRVGADGFEPP